MAEKVCVFGPGLVGILSQSSNNGSLAGAPAVLLWNVGMNHRVGPYRFFVDLARRLNALAGTILRFDVSGLGDSELQAGRGSDLVRAGLDLREAMSLLEKRTGSRRFIVVGFCSGVDAAYQLAIEDDRVAGVVLIEAYSFRSFSYYAKLYRKYTNPFLWRRFLTKKIEQLKTVFAASPSPTESAEIADSAGGGESVFSRQYPAQERFRQDITALVARGVPMLCMYSGISREFSHLDQFYELFCTPETRDKVDVIFYERADHTFSRVADRQRAVSDIVDWIQRKFGKQES